MEMFKRKNLLDDKYPERIVLETEKRHRWLKMTFLYIPILVWVLVTVFPFLYMLVLSTKSKAEIFTFPPPLFFSSGWLEGLTANYKTLLLNTHFWRNFGVSLYVAGFSSLISMFFCSLAGYGFAMYKFRAKEFLFGFLLFSMMIPAVVSIVPFFAQMRFFGWLNMPKALYLPVIANAYGVFLMRQFIEQTIPPSLVEAARIDGSSEIGIYFRVVLPMMKPALGTLGIITFLSSWNDFMRSLVVMKDAHNYTVPVALNSMKGMQSVDYGAIMIGSGISVLPLILVFAFMSRWIISRLTEGAVKG